MKENPLPYSDEKAHRIAYLVLGYLRKTLTVAEHDELDAWVEESDENMLLFEELTDERNIEANLAWMQSIETEKALEKTKKQLQFSAPARNKKRKVWPFIAAAAIVIVVIAIYLIEPKKAGTITGATQVAGNDVSPGGNKATLTLSNGTVIDLGARNTGLIQNESVNII
jgi:transmembrane sensor